MSKHLDTPRDPDPLSAEQADRLLNEGVAFKRLGLLTEAVGFLRMAMRNPEVGADAAELLVELETERGNYRKAYALGQDALKRWPDHFWLLDAVAIAANALHLHAHALEKFRAMLAIKNNSILQHSLACELSRLGEFPKALGHLVNSLGGTDNLLIWRLYDPDLASLWEHYSKVVPSLDEAVLLRSQVWKPLLFAGETYKGDPPVGHATRAGLPPELLPVLELDSFEAQFRISPSFRKSRPDLVEKYLGIQEARRHSALARIKVARRRAKEVLLEAQPDLAARALADGNSCLARYHVMNLLESDPARLGALASDPRLEGLSWLFSSLLDAEKRMPTFLSELTRFSLILRGKEGAITRDILDEMDSAFLLVADNPLVLLRKSNFAEELHLESLALPMLVKVCCLWPEDSAAYFNLALLLIKKSRWESAKELLRHVPKSFGLLREAGEIERCIKERDSLTRATSPFVPFFGQPGGGTVFLQKPQSQNDAVKPRNGTNQQSLS